jgi:hypothetical protein
MATSLVIQLLAGALGGLLGPLLRRGATHGPALNAVIGAIAGVGGSSLLAGVVGRGLAGDALTASVCGAATSFAVGLLRRRRTPTGV